MTIDANANVGPTVYDDFEFEPTLDQLKSHLDAADIDRAVVAPLAPPSMDFDHANARLAATLEGSDRFTGIARIDPRRDDSVEHADRALTELGLAGLKLHPWEESFRITAQCVPPVLEVAADHGVPVWVYAGYPQVSHALSIRDVANENPAVPLILTHAAQLDISGLSLPDALLLAEQTSNTYFELSGVYRRDLIEALVERVGTKRVVFGTNAPYFHPTVEKSRIATADITEDEKHHIFESTIRDLVSL